MDSIEFLEKIHTLCNDNPKGMLNTQVIIIHYPISKKTIDENDKIKTLSDSQIVQYGNTTKYQQIMTAIILSDLLKRWMCQIFGIKQKSDEIIRKEERYHG